MSDKTNPCGHTKCSHCGGCRDKLGYELICNQLPRDNTEPPEPRSADGSLSQSNSSKEFEEAVDDYYKVVTGSPTVQVTFSGSVPSSVLDEPRIIVYPYTMWKKHMALLHHKATQELVRETLENVRKAVVDSDKVNDLSLVIVATAINDELSKLESKE